MTGLRVGLASVLHWSDRLVRRAVAAYDGIFSLEDEDTASIYVNLAADMLRDGRVDDALEATRHALQRAPSNAAAWRLLGDIHMRREAYREAIVAIESAKKLGAQGIELEMKLADALTELERYKEAVDIYFEVLEARPRDAYTYYRLGVALDRLGHFEDAVTALRKAVEYDPRCVSYLQSLGFALESVGERQQAITYFKRALALEQRGQRAADH
jgi:tetratricopeptide (TPR) repeat protein